MDKEWLDAYNDFFIRAVARFDRDSAKINRAILCWNVWFCQDAKRKYYTGNPKCSDAFYDRCEDIIRRHAPNHAFLENVGYNIDNE